MNRKMTSMVVWSMIAPLASVAADYTLVSAPQSLADWRNDSFYEGEKAPPEDRTATIFIPSEMEVKIDDDSIGFVNGIRWLKPADSTAVVTVDVSTNSELYASVASGGQWSNTGVLRKKGAGVLTLMSTGRLADYGDYWVDFEIRQGAVKLMAGGYFGGWDVSSGAELILTGGASAKRTFVVSSPKGISGAGVVTNCTDATANYCVIQLNFQTDTPAVFSGKLVGNIRLECGGNQYLTGTGSTVSVAQVFQGRGRADVGVLGLAKIGMSGSTDSSIGPVDPLECKLQDPGRYVYLGTGETTDKIIQFGGYNGYPSAFDAGSYGGVTFKGYFLMGYENVVDRFWLMGSNAAPCYVAGSWGAYTYNKGKTYVTKKGTGTWRFADYTGEKRTGLGGFWIQDGTLGFETFNETNEVGAIGNPCSFFISDAFAENVDAAPRLPYCFRLGDTNDLRATGLVEYYGAKRVLSRTRPVVVDGTGGFLSSVQTDARGAADVNAYFHEASGISALTDKATLVLDGGIDGLDVVQGLSDGADGKLSVEKRGDGTWTIAGAANDFTGDIVVKKGTLVLRGVSGKFTWFRLVFTANRRQYYLDNHVVVDVTNYKNLEVTEVGLWDEHGDRVNGGLKLAPSESLVADKPSKVSPSAYPLVAPGEASIGWIVTNVYNTALVKLFDGTAGDVVLMMNSVDGDYACPTPSDARSHIPVLMRLPRSVACVSSYDVANYYKYFAPESTNAKYSAPNPMSWYLEGSVDGETWYKIDEVEESPRLTSGSSWLFTGVSVAGNCDHNENARSICGYTNDAVVVYSNPVMVEGGATIEAEGLVKLTSLKVDLNAENPGTVKGFVLADDLTLDVSNVPKGFEPVEVPLNFDGVGGLTSTAAWRIKIDGKVSNRLTAEIVDGKVRLNRSGLLLIVR